MRSRLAVTVTVMIGILARAAVARAQTGPSDPPVQAALLVGAAATLIPLAIGSSLISQPGALDHPEAPFAIMDAGLALAPLLAHGAIGEWKRGLAWTALSASLALGASAMLDYQPELIQKGDVAPRVSFGVLFTLALLSSGAGILDCLPGGERGRPAPLAIYPAVGTRALSVVLEGAL